jgi:PAS domain S-box-containing protein
MRETNNAPRRPARPEDELTEMSGEHMLELLPVGTFICDAEGVIVRYNRRAAEIWRRAPKPGQTHRDFSSSSRFFAVDGTPDAYPLLEHVLETGVPIRNVERRVERADGSTAFLSISIDPLRDADGNVAGTVGCVVDISDRLRVITALEESQRLAREQEQRLAATYEHAAIGIAEVAPDLTFLRVNEAICAITGRTREDLLSGKLFRYTHADDTDADREAFRKQVAGELEFYSVEKRLIRRDGAVLWVSVRSSPVRSASGQLLYLVRVVQDITERKRAERRQKLLIDELNHRVKNTLATVQSLAAQSARGGPSPSDFRERFEGRLIALSKAHDQLTMHHWENAELREMLSGSLAPYASTAPNRIVLRGEDLELRPRAVLTLAMAFHELTTNAAKYGSLSVPNGRVEITWAPYEDGGRTWLRITWTEEGGPPVAVPQRRGFGSRLIENGVAAELGGTARLAYDAAGVRCDMIIPLQTATGGVAEAGGGALT